MIENYFGLIEACFVFGLALAFYIWQRHTLKRDERLYQERLQREQEVRSGKGSTARHAEGKHGLDNR